MRVAVVQGKAGSSLFGTEGVCVDQPLLGLFCGWLRQGDDVATAEDGRFDGAAVGGTQDKAAVLRRFFEGFQQGIQRVGVVVVNGAEVGQAQRADGRCVLQGVAEVADVFDFAGFKVARGIGMGALREQVAAFALTAGAVVVVQAEGTSDDSLRHVVGIAALRVDEEQGGGQSVGKAVKAAVVQVGPGEHGGGSGLAQRF